MRKRIKILEEQIWMKNYKQLRQVLKVWMKKIIIKTVRYVYENTMKMSSKGKKQKGSKVEREGIIPRNNKMMFMCFGQVKKKMNNRKKEWKRLKDFFMVEKKVWSKRRNFLLKEVARRLKEIQ